MGWIFGALVFAVLCAATVFAVNRLRHPDYEAIEERPAARALPRAGPELTLLTWNVGYGALGAKAEMFIDGGKRVRALSRSDIITASSAMSDLLSEVRADVLCLQELACPGFLTRQVDMRGIIDARLGDYHHWFWADFTARLVPPPLRLRHGMGTYAALASARTRVLPLPGAETLFIGFLKKAYVGLMTHTPIEGSAQCWCVINVHLPVFKKTHNEKSKHVRRVLEMAQAEHAKGHLVAIAGDWNMQMSSRDTSQGLADQRSTWLMDFPQDALPDGWRIVQADGAPTVRALNAPFEGGRTFTATIDGIVVSPNVQVVSARVLDQQFQHADHNPVLAQLRRR